MLAHEIRTDRLLLRQWRPGDLDAYAEMCADPEVMRWIGDGRTRTRPECLKAISRFEAAWEQQGFGLFAVELQSSRALIGFAGLAVPDFMPEVMPAVEIGWRLSRRAWGQGFATEAARPVLQQALGTPKLERIVSIIQSGNVASERIAAKLCMTLERETIDPNCGRRVRVYEIKRQ